MLFDGLTRVALVGLELFLAASAISGGIVVVPNLPPEMLAGSPFRDYTIPALSLAVIVGGGALGAAALLIVRPIWGTLVSIAVGAGMMIFEIVETSVVGWDVWLHALGLSPSTGKGLPGLTAAGAPVLLGVPLPLWLQPFFFVYGALIVALAVRLWARRTVANRGY
jgi:hypothetical protein